MYVGCFSILSTEVFSVSVDSFFLSLHGFGYHSHIGTLAADALNCVNITTVPVCANMRFLSEMPSVPLAYRPLAQTIVVIRASSIAKPS